MHDVPDPRARWGVAVGKFNPPHLGHVHLLETGARLVQRLVVLVCDRPDQTTRATDRAAWLADACPDNVEVVITPDDLPTANEPWAERALEVLPDRPDLAFTSEPWGTGWAELMGARHHEVDLARSAVPITGTQLRADLGATFTWLVPAARAALARRVVVAGAESTGKTTLARDLAAALGTVWVPEYGRAYWEGRRYRPDQSWTDDEFTRIAEGQRRLERDLARGAARGVVVVDTDALVTSVWRHRYLGGSGPASESRLLGPPPDLYLVCAPDFAWVQDGTRESEGYRDRMHAETLELARSTGARVEIVTGRPDERLARALELVEPLTTFDPLT